MKNKKCISKKLFWKQLVSKAAVSILSARQSTNTSLSTSSSFEIEMNEVYLQECGQNITEKALLSERIEHTILKLRK